MKPGDPYETEALDVQRSRHRRLFRSLPDHDVVAACKGRPAVVEFEYETDKPLIETKLRELADLKLADADLEDLAERAQGISEWGWLEAHLNPHSTKDRDTQESLRGLQSAAELCKPSPLSQGVRTELWGVLLLLAMADDLTDYTDPRLKSSTE